jgi:hypothetical protein
VVELKEAKKEVKLEVVEPTEVIKEEAVKMAKVVEVQEDSKEDSKAVYMAVALVVLLGADFREKVEGEVKVRVE